MKKLAFIAGAIAFVSSALVSVTALATSGGYLAGGPDIYQVRNVTTNTAYSSSASVACNETVKYSVKLSNTEYGLISNINVKAPLTGTMTASGTNAASETVSTSGTVTVTPAAGSFSYIAGSTQLYDVNGNLIKALPDGITAGGVNVGNLNGSTREFVQFQAKLTCETPKKITVCELATKKIITIDEKDFDAAKHSTDLNKCKEVPPTKITVCEISTKKIITIYEKDFDASKHTKDLSKCKEVPPKKITVCELSTKKIVTINESDFDASKHSKDLSKCKEEVKKIKVCELATKKIVTINEKDFDDSKYSKDLNDCKETPVPGKIQVCELDTKTVITINEDDFDAETHSKDLNDCAQVLGEETPEVIPATGSTGVLVQALGLSSLVGASVAYARSRKLLG